MSRTRGLPAGSMNIENAKIQLDSSDAQKIPRIIGEKYSVEILCAAEVPKSPKEISKECDIPQSTCYRRIEELTELGLLEHVGTKSNPFGQNVNLYTRTVDQITFNWESSFSWSTKKTTPDSTSESLMSKFRSILFSKSDTK